MYQDISIHPPRAGRDVARSLPVPLADDFNPPSPCGEGRAEAEKIKQSDAFQSTLPVRGGTRHIVVPQVVEAISIHPPRAGRDCKDADH